MTGKIQGSTKAPRFCTSGLLDGVGAVSNQAPHYFPYGGTIRSIWVRVRTAMGTAAAEIRVGTLADADYFGLLSVLTTYAAGYQQKMTILQAAIVPGTILVFGGDGGATGTGDVDVLVIVDEGPG